MHKEYLILWDDYIFYKDGRIWSKYWKKFLTGIINKDGYLRIILKCNDGKQRMFYWHRVIWTYFNGEIPDGYQINHLNEIKTDNRLCNLELATPKENANYGTRNERSAAKRRGQKLSEETKAKLSESHKGKPNLKLSKAVEALDKDGNVVKRYVSISDAGRNGFDIAHVSECCRGLRNKCGGYGWRYA